MNWYKKTLKSDSKSNIISDVNNKEFIIMRGGSGSGKSFKAKQIAGDSGIIISADDFFIERGKGEYAFDPSLLSQAHQQCQQKAKEALQRGDSPVIIDNTNTTMWELKKLRSIIQYAQSLGYSTRIEEPETEWWESKNIDEMAERNSHGVPRETIKKMVNRFRENITVDDILQDDK